MSIGYIGHIPAQTLRIRKKRDGFVQVSGFKAVFFANFGAGTDEDGKRIPIKNPISSETPNEIIHFKRYSPTNSYYGVPDILSATQAVAGNEFAARFNLDYFENKAIPKHAIILKGAKLGAQAESRLLEFFETGLKGQNHRSVFIPLPGDSPENKVELKFEEIGASVQDSSFANYRKANMNDILMAHRVPITKVSTGEGASLAVARDADKTFKEQVCGPEQKIAEKKINKIIKELTDSYELKLNEMTLTDADTQSKIDERAVKNGWMLPNEIRARDGLPGIKGGNERVDPNAKAKQDAANANANRERDAQRSAGATDSAGEARNPKGDGRTTE
jgi:HK97 family phage portal protein